MIYNLESIIEEGKYKGLKVADIIAEDKKAIWQMIVKEHLQAKEEAERKAEEERLRLEAEERERELAEKIVEIPDDEEQTEEETPIE